MKNWPFNANVSENTWSMIDASGFLEPVPGCVYEGRRLDGGVPLGALGTGYFTLDGSGLVGHCSIYNDIVPPRHDFSEWLTVCAGNARMPLSTARISYWGHYPFVDIVAEFAEHPVTVGIRAFCPFIVGNSADSNIPAVLFEIEVGNQGTEALDIALEIDPPAPPSGKRSGVELIGSSIAANVPAGEKFHGTVRVAVGPGDAKRIRFVFAWYYPYWRDSGSEAHVHRYGTRFGSAAEVAADALERFDSLLIRSLSWQREIYKADYPAWLKDALVQGLYSLAKNSIWIAKTRKDEWWSENGWFSHNESHTDCPITETMVCRMHGHFPALFFFPELEESTLEAFRHFQISDGEIPFTFGMTTSLRDPRYHCQHPLNPGQYVQMIYRQFLRTGDKEQLEKFYDSAKRAIRYLYSLDDDDDGLVNDQAHVAPGEFWPANQFYDDWPWYGTSAYVAGTWLATLACGKAMAEVMADAEFAEECGRWLSRGQKAYEEKLWNGQYYRLWSDPSEGRISDVSLGNQLMAQWCVRVAGIADVLPAEKINAALDSIERLNMNATAYGLVNAATPAGESFDTGYQQVDDQGKNVFVGENLCAAMTYMYHGREETGLQIAKRIYETIAFKSYSPWNQRCIFSSESGMPLWGDDYYSNMVIWAVPMAIANQGIRKFTAKGGLIDRMIGTGNDDKP